ncbi:MAG: hypothetical protein K5669_10475 [Lachnospiraceae bacterium]|nr:hypothetical protein [Lachnospiraceae bacterium]
MSKIGRSTGGVPGVVPVVRPVVPGKVSKIGSCTGKGCVGIIVISYK